MLTLSALLLTGLWAQGRQQRLSERVLRLHVIARSDAPEDQAVKLRVRDALLAELRPCMARAGNAEEACRIAAEMLPKLERIAAEVSADKAEAALGIEYYPTRRYEAFALPAGRYPSLRLTLGEGAGRNWWCVVYPLLCTASREEACQTAALTDDDIRLITLDGTDCVLKFRIIEWWESLTAGERFQSDKGDPAPE